MFKKSGRINQLSDLAYSSYSDCMKFMFFIQLFSLHFLNVFAFFNCIIACPQESLSSNLGKCFEDLFIFCMLLPEVQ